MASLAAQSKASQPSPGLSELGFAAKGFPHSVLSSSSARSQLIKYFKLNPTNKSSLSIQLDTLTVGVVWVRREGIAKEERLVQRLCLGDLDGLYISPSDD